MGLKFLAALSACAAVMGCSTWPFAPEDDSCKAVYQGTSTQIYFQGIEIPLKTVLPIKIGQVLFTPIQLQAVTETIRSLQESRLELCKRSGDMLKATPPASPTELRLMYAEFDSAKKAERDFINALKNETDAQTVLKAADIAKKAADDTLRNSTPTSKLPPTAGAELIPELEKRIAALEASFRLKLAEKNQAKVTQFALSGFGSGGFSLSSSMKASLTKEVTLALEEKSQKRVPKIDVVGYADPSGIPYRNVNLGFRRATTVAEFLNDKFSGKIEIRSISSGGVKFNDPEARRVELTIADLFGAAGVLLG